jgi:antitoxin CptB
MNEPDRPAPALDARRRRLLYRATHRGTKETDLLVGGFVAPRLATLSEDDLDALETIMELPDVDLADWLTGRRPIPPEQDTPMLRRIRAATGA